MKKILAFFVIVIISGGIFYKINLSLESKFDVPDKINIYMDGRKYIFTKEHKEFKEILDEVNKEFQKGGGISKRTLEIMDISEIRDTGKAIEFEYNVFKNGKFKVNNVVTKFNYDKVIIPLDVNNTGEYVYIGDEKGYGNSGISIAPNKIVIKHEK